MGFSTNKEHPLVNFFPPLFRVWCIVFLAFETAGKLVVIVRVCCSIKNMERVQEMITKKSKSLQKPWGKIHFLLITKIEKRRVFVVHTTSTKSPYGRSTLLFLCAWKYAIDWYVRSTLFTFNQETKGLSFYLCLKNDEQIGGTLQISKVNFKWYVKSYQIRYL